MVMYMHDTELKTKKMQIDHAKWEHVFSLQGGGGVKR